MKNKENFKLFKSKFFYMFLFFLVVIVTSVIILFGDNKNEKISNIIMSKELLRAMEYEKFDEDDKKIENTDNIEFSAFFLRDLDGDGYAEKIKGTCRPLGKDDTIYMELNVLTEGYLKDAKITIDSKNFYLQTVLPKDSEFKNNYIGNNTKIIEFNDLNCGTQKLIQGKVRSGDYSSYAKVSAIGNNINDYSRDDNKITLTGIYVDSNGNEEEIKKEILIEVDWYGTVKASTYYLDRTQDYTDLPDRINEEKKELYVDFKIRIDETENLLNLSKNCVEAEIPTLNGYDPLNVELTNTTTDNINFSYDEESRKVIIEKNANVNENGDIIYKIYASNEYNIKITYPLEAYYEIGGNRIEIEIPFNGYYEGFNNTNEEFDNPYKSNVVDDKVRVTITNPIEEVPNITMPYTHFYVNVGRYIYYPIHDNIVSKRKPLRIYNGVSEKEIEDTYLVRWDARVYKNTDITGLTMNSQRTDEFIKSDNTVESMDNITKNVGVYFSGFDNLLYDDGFIKIYDETNNLIATFYKEDWNKYTSENPYIYENAIKHIRIETSNIKEEAYVSVYNIKELDDEYITTNYTKAEFDNLKYIKSYMEGVKNNVKYDCSDIALYLAPYSIADIEISKNIFSTQTTEYNDIIKIKTNNMKNGNQIGWYNATYLVKFPKEILTVNINDITVDDKNIKVISSEIIETQDGVAIKINTENNTEDLIDYSIKLDVDITPDPRTGYSKNSIELYAINGENAEYLYNSLDIYDIDNDFDYSEIVNKTTTNIELIAPNSLLTNQSVSGFDDKGTVIISPKVAALKPNYNSENGNIAKIGVHIRNNYTSTISETLILGKIPFKGNSYVISGNDLNSEFSTQMLDGGIEIPEELRDKINVYYSENENPTKDIYLASNGWIKDDGNINWDNIKTYLIDFNGYVIESGKEYTFYYGIEIENNFEYNLTTYSHHGVYFSLDTEEGKYQTQTEPNKLGFMITDKYDLNVSKYQKDKENLVPGAIYSITELNNDGTAKSTRTAVTNEQGQFVLDGLLVEKIYEIKEIRSPRDYELNEDIIKFIAKMDRQGKLSIEIQEGYIREDAIVEQNESTNLVKINIEDEANVKLNILKSEKGTNTFLQFIKFKIKGKGLPSSGRIITTDENGLASLNGLKVNEEYTIEEVKADGYYLNNPIKFIIYNKNGEYTLDILEGEVKSSVLVEENYLPTVNLEIENDKKSLVSLEINKVKTILNSEIIAEEILNGNEETVYLQGAKFKLYKNNIELGTYITDENGKIVINDLYEYIEGKNEDAIYTIKEIASPQGYSKAKDITFKIQKIDGTLKFINMEGIENKYIVSDSIVKLIIEDSPSFKLIKKDKETGETLAGVKFAIYNIDEEEVPARDSKGEILGTLENINGTEYYTLTTDTNGSIIMDLPEGLYKAVEVETLEKYAIKNPNYYFGIGRNSEGVPTYIFESVTELYSSSNSNETIKTMDGSYIILGNFTDIELNDGTNITSDGFAKYNSNGEIEYKKALSGIKYFREASDGGYMIYGEFLQEDIFRESGIEETNLNGIIKFNMDGQFLWFRPIELEKNESINNLITTNDGGYFLTSYTRSKHDFGWECYGDSYWEKYDENGVLEHSGYTRGTYRETISNIFVNNDGSFYILINTESQTTTLENGAQFENVSRSNHEDYIYPRLNDPILVKYNNQYEYEWGFDISGYNAEYINFVYENNDGEVIVKGNFSSCSITLNNGITFENPSCGYDCVDEYGSHVSSFTALYDRNGNCQWVENNSFISIIQKENGNYILMKDDGFEEVDEKFNNITSHYLDEGISIDSLDLLDNDKIELIVTTDGICKIDENTTIGSEGEIKKYRLVYCLSSKTGITLSKMINYIDGRAGQNGDAIELKDGSYVIAVAYNTDEVNIDGQEIINNSGSYSVSEGAKDSDILLIKYNNEEVEWVRGIGGRYSDYVSELKVSENDGIILNIELGSYEESNTTEIKLDEVTTYNIENDNTTNLLIEYDKNGNILEITEKGCPDENNIKIGNETIQIYEKYIGEYKDGCYKVVIEKIDSDGNIIWNKVINENAPGSESCVFFDKLPNENIVFAIKTENSFIEFENGDILNISQENIDLNTVFITMDVNGNILGYDLVEGVISSLPDTEILCDNDKFTIYLNRTLDSEYYSDYKIIRITFDSEGKIVKLKNLDYYSKLFDISAKGYIGFGNFSGTDLGDGVILNNTCLVRCDQNDNVQWVYQLQDVSGIGFLSQIGNDKFIGTTYNYQASRYSEYGEYDININVFEELKAISQCQEFIVENERKEFEITTRVNEFEGEKGGTISGENTVYDKVLYGDSSKKEISIVPNDGYEIRDIKVNGVEIQFTANEDGTYVISSLDNIIEDTIVEATFVLKEKKLIINKVDEITNEPISNVTFELQQIDEREIPNDSIKDLVENGDSYTWLDYDVDITDDVVGELTDNGEVYEGIPDKTKDFKTEVLGKLVGNSEDAGVSADKTIELVDSVGNMINNGTYYFVEQDGYYIPTNSKKYQVNNGGTSGIQSSIANSYIEIDLTGYEGEYVAVVNANVSSESCDYGYAFIKEDTTTPSYWDSEGRFVYIAGTSSSVNTDKDYTSMILEGGKKYYLHLGYYKDGSVDSGDDVFTVNSIKVYGTKITKYDFIEQNGTYESTNKGAVGTTSSSYIEIDLTNHEGQYIAVINAGISSYYNDYGYITITESSDRPSPTSTEGRIVYVSGYYYNVEPYSNEYKSMTLEGGKKYYLHMGYSKSQYSSNRGADKFVINSINIYKLGSASYNFVEVDGKYESNNVGEHNTTASSYIPIDLTNYEGNYRVALNACISSEYNSDYGRAFITETTERPNIDMDECFVELDGYPEEDFTGTGLYALGEYPSQTLEGGKKYYLHLMYSKDDINSMKHDKFIINSVNVYGIIVEKYDFIEKDGRLESTNNGRKNSVCTSYIPIDLTNYEGKYNIIVNANISSEKWKGIGYAAVTETTDKPYMYDENNFIYIHGNDESVSNPKDYIAVVEGGKMYYLHFGYNIRSSYSYEEDEEDINVDDKFYINDVSIILNGSDLYNTKVTSNSLGKAIAQVPFGKYSVKEISTPEEYELDENITIIEFRDVLNNEFVIKNKKVAKVIVHHYKAIDKGDGIYEYTEEKILEDEILSEKSGREYITTPKLDIEQYELIKDKDGEYILPENAKGQYISGEQEVSYYYAPKENKVITNHYIIGTEQGVKVSDGTIATSDIQTGSTGEKYTTKSLEDKIHEKYELVERPDNAEGEFINSDIIVNYYYDVKKFDIKTSVEKHIEVDEFDRILYVAGGAISGEEYAVYENVKYGESSTKEIVIIPDEGYKVGKIKVNDEPIIYNIEDDGSVILDDFYEVKEDKIIIVEFIKETGRVRVEHRVDETMELVESITEGEFVPDRIKEGSIGSRFMTKPSEDVSLKYEVVNSSEYTSGIYKEEEQTVTYYYDLRDIKYKVEYYYNGILDPNKTEEGFELWGNVVNSYEDKIDESYNFDRVENYPLTISENEEENIIKVYYELKDSNIVVKYVDKETGEEIAESKTISGKITQKHDLNEDIIEIENYTFKEFEQGNEIEFKAETKEYIIYYALNTKVTVNYIDEITGEIIDTNIIDGKVGDEYRTYAKEYDGYIIKEKPENENGIMTKDEIIINYYYIKVSEGVVVKHIDVYTQEILDSSYYTGLEGDDYITDKKDFVGYDILTNKQYYKKFIVEQYSEEKINELLMQYNVITKEELFEKYGENLVLDILKEKNISSEDEYLPMNKNGTMTKELIEIKYYYIKQTKVKVEHVNKQTGEIISYEEPIDFDGDGEVDGYEIKEAIEIINGHEGDKYDTEPKEFEGYELLKDEFGNEIIPANSRGEMTSEEIVVRYEYIENAKVIEKHIDIKTNEVIEEIVHNAYVDKEYTTNARKYDNYVIVKDKLPQNAEGKMTKEEIIVEYYYIHKAKVIVEYLDNYSGEILKEIVYIDTNMDDQIDKVEYENSTVIIEGFEGDEYETFIKEFDNYKLVEEKIPDNANGEMTKEDINVKYYYVKKSAGVLEEHKDFYSNELLEEAKMHYGYEGDEYSTFNKEFKNYNLKLDAIPENANGTMKKDLITVTYYYIRKSEVIVKYVEDETGIELSEEVVIKGQEGDYYTTTEKNIEGYDLVRVSENKEGNMKNNVVVVTYYYAKKDMLPQEQLPEENKPTENEESNKPIEEDKVVEENVKQPTNINNNSEENKQEELNKEQEKNTADNSDLKVEQVIIIDKTENKMDNVIVKDANANTNTLITNNIIKDNSYNKDEEIETPDTGDKTPIVIISLLMLMVLINMIYVLNESNKKSIKCSKIKKKIIIGKNKNK